MDSPDRDLPDFEAPPLIEVAISVQFEPIPDLQTPQIGLLWSRFVIDSQKQSNTRHLTLS